MSEELQLALPLPSAELPESIRRFAAQEAPAPAKMMAAKGMVPVRGNDLVVLLVQLSADPDATVSAAANGSFGALPSAVIESAASAALHPAVLHRLATTFLSNEPLIQALILNHHVSDFTVVRIARGCSEELTEVIAFNQQRMLRTPLIIEALYQNRNTRMSTADRIIEFAARSNLQLNGIPNFEAIVAAIKGQLLPEPDAEPLPSDEMFKQALKQDKDEEAIKQEGDEEEVKEEIKEEFKSLDAQIRTMNMSEKIRMALLGNAAARSILVRDPNRVVAMAAIGAPSMGVNEVKKIANSREVHEDVLRHITKKRDWMRLYEIKKSLVCNPKTPIGISATLLVHLRKGDLKNLTKNRGVPAGIRRMAKERLATQGG